MQDLHQHNQDDFFMREAIKEAQKAMQLGEVPVGCVIVCNQIIIARAHNLTERLCDVTAHAEMQAITSAANHIGGKYLKDCTMYITLEPCIMCAGALGWSHIGRVVYGAFDKKKGFNSKYGLSVLHPKTSVTVGLMETTCSKVLSDFFKDKRS